MINIIVIFVTALHVVSAARVAIIGGGVAGASVAFHLRQFAALGDLEIDV